MRPAGAVFGDEDAVAGDGGVGSVGAVKGDAAPVHEFVASVDGGEAHGVVIINGPGASFRNAAESVIETNGETFLGDIDLFI